MHFISVDGGATKTISVLYNDNFEIESIGISGPTNFRTVGIVNFRKNIKDAINQLNSFDVDSMSFALPGIKDTSESLKMIYDELKKLFPNKKIKLYNDGEAGFHCRFLEENGIVIAAGTGMVSYGKNKSISVKSSGWGWFLDDEGGAFYIARRALEEVVKIMDGRGKFDSTLVDSLRKFFNLKNDKDLINIIYKGRIDIRKISSIAPIVSMNALKGDFLSKKIMEESAVQSSKSAWSTYRKLGFPEKISISGYGGVFRAGKWYWEMIVNELKNIIGNAEFIEPYFGYEAILGSIVLNYRENGIEIKGSDLEILRKILNEKISAYNPDIRRKYLYF
ncbi:MAG: BadF/BadG/BcrA/BcrD ATPase family protein [Thermoplasmata archaeon]